MSQALLTDSSNNFSDEFRSEAQLTWMALLLALFALGAVFVWSLSNQQLLMPSAITADAPVAQLSQLPKRVEISTAQSTKVGAKVISETVISETVIGETPVFETKKISAITAIATAANDVDTTAVAELQSDAAPVVDTAVKVATVNDPIIDIDLVEPTETASRKIELNQVELVGADVVVDSELSRAEVKQAAVAPIEDPATIAELQKAPVVDPSSEPVEAEVLAELALDKLLLTELTAARLAENSVPVTPPETAFEKLRREELAMLATHSDKLQIDPALDALDSATTSQLFQIFDLLFLYSEIPVSVTVKSNDTDSILRNMNQAQQRGDKIVDYLVLMGLDRSRFNIIAESSPELPLGSHLIAIQATLEP